MPSSAHDPIVGRHGGRLHFTFSLAERERRHDRARAMMAARGFDALLVPCNTGHNDAFQADVRYLTQIGGFANEAAAFFPKTGAVTCWVRNDSQPFTWWQQMQDWVPDVRPSVCNWADNFAVSIREHRLEAARFGVVGIGGTPRSPDGLVLHGTMARLQDWFPAARFETATDAMADVRMIKGAEEIVAMTEAARIAELAVLASARVAREGVCDHEVYAEIVAEMLRHGGELPTLILWGAGAAPQGMSRLPPYRAIGAHDVLFSEIEARYAGFVAQVRRPVFIGTPSDDYMKLHAVAVESFNRMLALMRPGVTFGEVIAVYADFVKREGYKPLGVPFRGCGMGEDLPLIMVRDLRPETLAQKLAAGQTYIVGPRAGLPDESKFLAWGDTVVVEPRGARRLGTLPQDPIRAH
jgi:Xaa-Pro aminopeptidase